jgi:flagellar motor switch protein FliM
MLRERLAGIEITIVAEVGSIDMPMRDVLALRVGDIIRLQNMRVSDPMALKIGDRKKFNCRPGVVGNKLAVQVLKKLEDLEQAEFEELVADEGEEA